MQRLAPALAAIGILTATAIPAFAHHYHGHSHSYYHGHHGCGYYSTYYGRYLNSTCSYYITQGDAWYDQNNFDQAVTNYTQAIANDPNCALAYNQRSAAWYAKGDFDKAIADATLAIANNGSFASAYNNRAAALDAKAEYDKALADTNLALAIEPSFPEAYISRGAIWYNKGEYDRAIADDNAALAIDPNLAQAYCDRAGAWNMKGTYDKAKADFYQAIALDASNAAYYSDLAFFQATCLDVGFRDAQQAFANASKAYQLSNGNVVSISVLASVYAENGDFAQAITWQQKALDMTKSPEMKQRYLARLVLFKQSKPFRLDPQTAMQIPSVAATTAK
jgi:tetratricopeptide (TPR) repeat protein